MTSKAQKRTHQSKFLVLEKMLPASCVPLSLFSSLYKAKSWDEIKLEKENLHFQISASDSVCHCAAANADNLSRGRGIILFRSSQERNATPPDLFYSFFLSTLVSIFYCTDQKKNR